LFGFIITKQTTLNNQEVLLRNTRTLNRRCFDQRAKSLLQQKKKKKKKNLHRQKKKKKKKKKQQDSITSNAKNVVRRTCRPRSSYIGGENVIMLRPL
jgi:hypothetical protein